MATEFKKTIRKEWLPSEVVTVSRSRGNETKVGYSSQKVKNYSIVWNNIKSGTVVQLT